MVKHHGKISMRIATLNAESMIDGTIAPKVGAKVAGKGMLVRNQLHKAGIILCGIQEARLRAGSWPTEHYQVYSSGAVKGNWGCALLVATESPYARASDDTALVFKPSQITPVFGDERILVLKFNAPLFRRTVI